MSSPTSAVPLPPDVNRGHVYFGTLVGFLVPSVLIVLLRIWARTNFSKMWLDDYLMIIAIAFLIANNTLSIISINHGIGRHIVHLTIPNAMTAAKMNIIAQPLNVLALYFVKISIVFFLVRLRPDKKFLYVLYFTLGLLTVITIEVFVVTMAQCQPIAKGWNPTLPGLCWSPNVFQNSAYALSAVTIFTDIVYIILPIVFLWNVQLKKSIKYGIWSVLGLGSVSMACSIAAVPFIYQLGLSADPTYDIIELASIKTAELNIAIIVGCLPSLQPLFKKVGQKITTKGSSATAETWESRQARLKKGAEYEMLANSAAGNNKNTYGMNTTVGHSRKNVSKSHSTDILATTVTQIERDMV